MTSRERVLRAFRHEEPDRTPFFEKLVKSPVADEVLGRPHAGVNWHYRMERLADDDWEGLMQQEARDTIDLARILGFDLVRLRLNELPPAERPRRIGRARRVPGGGRGLSGRERQRRWRRRTWSGRG